jgi:exodeoxyribonuclease III
LAASCCGTDAIRHLNPGARVYTFWEYTRCAWGRGLGLRIDRLLLNPAVARLLAGAGVDRHVRGWDRTSDHAPAWVELRDADQVSGGPRGPGSGR